MIIHPLVNRSVSPNDPDTSDTYQLFSCYLTELIGAHIKCELCSPKLTSRSSHNS